MLGDAAVVRSLGGRDCDRGLQCREARARVVGGYLMRPGGNLVGNVDRAVTERGRTRLMS